MKIKKLMTNKLLIGPVMGAMLGVGILTGYTIDKGIIEGSGSNGVKITREISDRGGGEAFGEHGGISGSESGNEAVNESGAGSEEGSGAQLALNDTFDAVRGGAQLTMSYDPASNAFIGAVENTTNNTLTNVRIEVHLSNGIELGPTTPIDLAPGEVASVNMPASQAPFTGWVPHAEVGSGESSSQSGGGEGSGEHGGAGGESGSEGGNEGDSGVELNEAAMSSPVIPLDQTWNGNLGGLAISARYDAATQSVISTVQNTTSQTLCYVQAEPHLKSGTQTVGELGPDVLGDLLPGQTVTSSVSVASEPGLAGVSYDGYVVHMEVFDCNGPGPQPHASGQAAEGIGEVAGREGGNESGGEGASGHR